MHAIFEGEVGFFEGIKCKLNLMRSTRDVVFGAIRILDGKTVVPLWAAINAIVGLRLSAV